MNNYRILVVDDEDDLCEILKFNLEMEGYTVDTANSAEEALKLDIPQYNLLLLDVMMGEISGFKMARILKSNKDTANIPPLGKPDGKADAACRCLCARSALPYPGCPA